MKVAASFYDPLGLILPITVRVKIIFQLLCKDCLDWDEIIPNKISLVWKSFLSDLDTLNCLRVERFVCNSERSGEILQVHGFCDSSKQAYCAAVYFRLIDFSGISVKLVSAKTKVAPLKELSIPRLELLACVLLSDLIESVCNALKFRFDNLDIYCWSDSEVVICWLKGDSKCWRPWVENRVVKCRKVVSKERWNHVDGKNNPADVPTRLESCSNLLNKSWLHGPEFLYDVNYCFKEFNVSKKLEEVKVLVESKKLKRKKAGKGSAEKMVNCSSAEYIVGCICVDGESIVVGDMEEVVKEVMIEHVNLVSEECIDMDNEFTIHKVMDINRFSTLVKLICTTAYVMRFVNNLKARIKRNSDFETNEIVSVEEYDRALDVWIRSEQYIFRKKLNFQKIKIFTEIIC